ACPTGTSYTDTGLTDGTTYHYVVSAAYTGGPNAGGASGPSPEATATPVSLTPPAPTGLSAAPCSAKVTLSWNSVSTATSYSVKRATTSGGPYAVLANQAATSYVDGSATNGTTWYYVVSASNAAGEGPNSSQVSASPPGAPPAAPTALNATA